MNQKIKISQLPAKGANLSADDLLEVAEFTGTGYISKSITGQEIIDAAAGGGSVTDVTATAPIESTGGTTPDISIRQSGSLDDGYLSSADWIAFNNKQEALVSGTNIKTVNGNSLLGSGNVTISGGGGGVHVPIYRSGSVYTYMVTSVLSFGVSTNSNQRIYAMPFIPSVSFTSASFWINVTTLQAGALARILIYSSLNGRPDQKLYESTDLDLSTTGQKTVTASFSFTAGTIYFMSLHTSGTAIVSGLSATCIIPITLGGISAPTTYFFPTITYPIGSAPTTFGNVNQGNGNVPLIGITAA